MTKYILLLFTFFYSVRSDDLSLQLLINTSSLGLIQGEINPNLTNVRQFIGIPFAQPPLGSLRFKPPVSLSPFNGSSSNIYNATAAAHLGGFPSLTCFQISTGTSNTKRGTEDCLYLDIFLPLYINNGTLLPVVIFIYGGGFQVANSENPSYIISQYQNVVYVTIRYRENVFGFMASTALSASRSGPIQSSGLQGFEDQQMAIQWVRDNIQAFGGNPNLITLQGQSAGAISTCLHLFASGSRHLFQRAIIESGGCDIIHWFLEQKETIGDEISLHFCNSSTDTIACLQSLNATTLVEYAKEKDYLDYFLPDALFPFIDGLIFSDSITNLFEKKEFATNISILTGTTNGEFGKFIVSNAEPGWQVQNLNQSILSEWVQFYSNGKSAYLNQTYNPYNISNVSAELVNYYALNDALSTYRYQCPVRRTAAHLLNSGNGSVYLYSFNYVSLSSSYYNLSQAVHGDELPFVFNEQSAMNSDEQLLAGAMSLLWNRFSVHGNPNTPVENETSNSLINQLSGLGGWPKYSTENSSTYIIFSNKVLGNSSATIQLATSGYHSPTCEAWDAIVPNLNVIKRCNSGYTGLNCVAISSTTPSTASAFRFGYLWFLIVFTCKVFF